MNVVSDEIRKEQADRVKSAIKECGLSQKELAAKLNYTTQYISYIINGKRSLSEDFVKKLCDCLNSIHPSQTVESPISVREIEDEKERNNLIAEGYFPAEYVTSSHSMPYYTTDYFLCESEFPNSEIAFEQTLEDHYCFVKILKKIIRNTGYELEIGENFLPLAGFLPLDTIPEHISFHTPFEQSALNIFPVNGSKDVPDYASVQDLATGEKIPLSYIETELLFSDMFSHMKTCINSLFIKNKTYKLREKVVKQHLDDIANLPFE